MTNAKTLNTTHDITYDRDADGQYINIRCSNCGTNMEDPVDFPCPEAPQALMQPVLDKLVELAADDPWTNAPADTGSAPF